jgi:hypothetical protein
MVKKFNSEMNNMKALVITLQSKSKRVFFLEIEVRWLFVT